jgi:hypothetical protein
VAAIVPGSPAARTPTLPLYGSSRDCIGSFNWCIRGSDLTGDRRAGPPTHLPVRTPLSPPESHALEPYNPLVWRDGEIDSASPSLLEHFRYLPSTPSTRHALLRLALRRSRRCRLWPRSSRSQ